MNRQNEKVGEKSLARSLDQRILECQRAVKKELGLETVQSWGLWLKEA